MEQLSYLWEFLLVSETDKYVFHPPSLELFKSTGKRKLIPPTLGSVTCYAT